MADAGSGRIVPFDVARRANDKKYSGSGGKLFNGHKVTGHKSQVVFYTCDCVTGDPIIILICIGESLRMRILVVGLGSIGRRHIKNLKQIDKNFEVGLLRQKSRDKNLSDLKNSVDQIFLTSKEALRWQPKVVLIANPATFHIPTALQFAKNECDLFIEKPLSHDIKNVDKLLKICESRQRILMVGYVLRFSKSFQLIKKILDQKKLGKILSIHVSVGKYLPDWRPRSDYRQNVSARWELGGGVVNELSHELDYARWFVGEVKEVFASMGKVSDLETNVEDLAEINLRFTNGALGHVHLDMLDRAGHRSCRIIGTDGSLIWDAYPSHRIRFFSSKTNQWKDLFDSQLPDYNQMFEEELKYFFHCVRQRKNPSVNGAQGRRIVEIILAIKRSAKTKRAVLL